VLNAAATVRGEPVAQQHGRTPRRVLAVCSGNTCRSAMLMAALKLELTRTNRTDVIVESAGSGKRAGERLPASEHARTLFPGMLEDHRSTSIANRSLTSYDHILCMTYKHRSDVLAQCEVEAAALAHTAPRGPQEAPLAPEAEAAPCPHEGGDAPCSDAAAGPAAAGHATAAGGGGCSARIAVFPGELEDPIGQPRAVYEACALRIRAWAAELVREAL